MKIAVSDESLGRTLPSMWNSSINYFHPVSVNECNLYDRTHSKLYWVPYQRRFTNQVKWFYYNITEQSLRKFYHEVPRRKIFLLAKSDHLLTNNFGIQDYCLLNNLTFLHNPAHCIGLEALTLTKQLLLTVSTIVPNTIGYRSLSQCRHTHQLSPTSLPSPS